MESPSADPQPTNCLQADFSEDYVISMGTLNQINEINMQNNPLHNTYKWVFFGESSDELGMVRNLSCEGMLLVNEGARDGCV